METTNNSENPQRRVDDRAPGQTIDWAAPGAPAVPAPATARLQGATVTNEQITAGAAVKADDGQAIGRNAAIEVWDAMHAVAPAPITQAPNSAELDLQQLKALALAATPGPWHWVDNMAGDTTKMAELRARHNAHVCDFGDGNNHDPSEGTEPGKADMDFIVAANPAVVLDLIARIERQSLSLDATASALGGNFDAEAGYAMSVVRVMNAWQAEVKLGETYKGIAQDSARIERATAPHAAPRPTDDELWDATLRDRDAYHEWADKLAGAIAIHFGAEIGEHSNMNLPWAEALEVIESANPAAPHGSAAPTEAAPGCDHCEGGWVYSPDRAMRGACYYCVLKSQRGAAPVSGGELPKPKAPADQYFSDEPVYSAAEVIAIRDAAVSASQAAPTDDEIRTLAARFDVSMDATKRWKFRDVVPFARALLAVASQAAPVGGNVAGLSATQMFEVAAPYFGWDGSDWRDSKFGTINMANLLNYTKAAILADRAAVAAAKAPTGEQIAEVISHLIGSGVMDWKHSANADDEWDAMNNDEERRALIAAVEKAMSDRAAAKVPTVDYAAQDFLAAARVALVSLAHAAEKHGIYQTDYERFAAAIEKFAAPVEQGQGAVFGMRVIADSSLPSDVIEVRNGAKVLGRVKNVGAGVVPHLNSDGRLSDELRDLIEGMSVSIDVSTGEHDSGNRLFGVVSEVMNDNNDKCGVTLLVYDAKPNFTQGAGVVPEGWTVEYGKFSAPGTIRLHSAKWGGAFLGEPKRGDITLPAIVYHMLADSLAVTPTAATAHPVAADDQVRTGPVLLSIDWSTDYLAEVRDQALEEAAKACEAWGNEKVAKWSAMAGDDEDARSMVEDAKARAWDALQCAAAIRALSRTTAHGGAQGEQTNDRR